MAEVGQLSSLVRESEKARAQDMRSINGAIGELAEGQGRVLAELAARARRDSDPRRTRSRGCTDGRGDPHGAGPLTRAVKVGQAIARGGHRVWDFEGGLSTGSEAEMDTNG